MTAAGPSRAFTLPFPLLLALRYLRSTRRDAYVTFLSLLAGGGIALGVAALVLVLAALSGLQDFLRRDVLERTPHLEVSLPPGADAAAVREAVAAVPGVVAVHRFVRGRGWLRGGSRVVDVAVVGYEGALPAFFPDPSPAVAGAAPGLWLGDVVAAAWGVSPGDAVDLVSALPTLTPFGPQPRIERVVLAGTFRVGHTEDGERRAAVPLAVARRLFGARQERLEVRAPRLEDADAVAQRLAGLLPAGSEVRTWEESNRGLFFALRLEKMLMAVSVFLIVPVAAMALVTVLALLISSKRAEIGMLQAMGATPNEIRRAFGLLGGLLAALGLAGGAGVGVGLAVLLDRYHLLRPPGDAYFVDHVPFRVEALDLGLVAGATVVLTALSTLWAARRAAAMGPVEALRA